MKIDVNVQNSSVSFQNQTVDLSAEGIYLVTGPNGVGKTTILKNIVFTRHFNDANRNHFSYVEQDPEKYEVSVKNYLHRYNHNVSDRAIKELLEAFGLCYLTPNSTIMNISGGELVKLNIISALLKENSFVFLDEPTNNLDNKSVESLKEVLQKYAEGRVVVIVSHDPRLVGLKHHSIIITAGSIEVQYLAGVTQSEMGWASEKNVIYPWWKILRHHFLRPVSIVNVILLLVYAGMFIFVNHVVYVMLYDSDELASKDGSILAYSVDEEYGEINQYLAECEKIDISEDKYYAMIQYQSIPSLVAEYEFENVYIEDEVSLSLFYRSLREKNDSSEPPVIAIPQIVQGYCQQVFSVGTPLYIAEGRFPYDQCNEIVTSQNIIDSLFPGSSLGDTVIWEENEYTLVGVHFLDIVVVSYDLNDSNGLFYRYSPDTFDDFIERQMKYHTDAAVAVEQIYRPNSLIMQTSASKERSVLLEVFSQYPANNYRSYSYDKDLSDYYNRRLITAVLLANIGIGIVIGLIFSIVNRKRIALCRAEAMSIDNYYLTAPLTLRLYRWGDAALNGIIWGIYLIIAYNVAKYDKEFGIMAIGYGLLCLVASLQIRRVRRKND